MADDQQTIASNKMPTVSSASGKSAHASEKVKPPLLPRFMDEDMHYWKEQLKFNHWAINIMPAPASGSVLSADPKAKKIDMEIPFPPDPANVTPKERKAAERAIVYGLSRIKWDMSGLHFQDDPEKDRVSREKVLNVMTDRLMEARYLKAETASPSPSSDFKAVPSVSAASTASAVVSTPASPAASTVPASPAAASPSPPVDCYTVRETSPLISNEHLTEELRFFMQNLGFKDWRADVRLVPEECLKPKTVGNSHWDLDAKSIKIKALNPSDAAYHAPEDKKAGDVICTEAHELMHVKLADMGVKFPNETPDYALMQEYTVVTMTNAFLEGQYGASSCYITPPAANTALPQSPTAPAQPAGGVAPKNDGGGRGGR